MRNRLRGKSKHCSLNALQMEVSSTNPESQLSVAEKLFVIVPRVDHPHPDYFFAGDPFEGKKGRNKEGAENGTQKVFHNVVRPVPLFDELADWDY